MSDDNAEQEMARLESYPTEHLGEEIVDASVLAEGLNRLIQISTVNDPQAYVVRQPNKSRGDGEYTGEEIHVNTWESYIEESLIQADTVPGSVTLL
jgi:hypothetical protein